jgi:CRISPR system Cascade subunit CasB
MSDHARSFIDYLSALSGRDRGALAVLRRSLTFEPGTYPAAYPYVERFVGADRYADDPRRLALYLTAGLYAMHPKHQVENSFAAAFGNISQRRDRKASAYGDSNSRRGSMEQRFIALLSAEPQGLPTILRQATSVAAADGCGFDYIRLLDDLSRWLNPLGFEDRDRLRQRWARDFYRAYDGKADDADAETESISTEPTV